MPIMAAQGRSDARGAARLLASLAINCIDNPKLAREQLVALNNIYRLLESYRGNVFFGQEPPREQPKQNASQKLTLKVPIERHVKEVRDAFEGARKVIFAEDTKEHAIETIEQVLRSIASSNVKNVRASVADKAKATAFFKEVVERL
jgi:hypothetical protein